MNSFPRTGFGAPALFLALALPVAAARAAEDGRAITEWLVSTEAGPEWAARAPEGGVSSDGVRWRLFRSGAAAADFGDLARRESGDRGARRIAAHADVFAPRDADAALLLRCDAPVAIFWNGEEIARRRAPRVLDRGPAASAVRLRAGWNRLFLLVETEGPGPALLSARLDSAAPWRAAAQRPPRAADGGPSPRARDALEIRGRPAPLAAFADLSGRVFVSIPLEVEASGEAARHAIEIRAGSPEPWTNAATLPPREPAIAAPGERRAARAAVPLRDFLLAAVHGTPIRALATAGRFSAAAAIPPPSPRAALAAFFSPARLEAPRGVDCMGPEPLHAAFEVALVVEAESGAASVLLPGESAPRRVAPGERAEFALDLAAERQLSVDDGGAEGSIRLAIRPRHAAAEAYVENADAALAAHGYRASGAERLERDACAALAAGEPAAFEAAIAAAAAPLDALASRARRLRVIRAALPATDAGVARGSFEDRVESERRSVEDALDATRRRRRDVAAIGASGAAALALAERYPDLAADARRAVAEGRLRVTGGSFADLAAAAPLGALSGETLVRQFVLGQLACEAAYGAAARVAWIPRRASGRADALPGVLPQILAQCGFDSLISGEGEEGVFVWEGSDGSSVLVARPPRVPAGDPLAIARAGMRFAGENGGLSESIVLEAGRARGVPRPPAAVLPRIERASAEEFFSAARRRAAAVESEGGPPPFATRRGDLRAVLAAGVVPEAPPVPGAGRAEAAIHAAETLATFARALEDESPSRAAGEASRDLLAATGAAGTESAARRMEDARAAAAAAAGAALARIASAADTRALADGVRVVVANPLAFERTDLVEAEIGGLAPAARYRFVDARGASGPVEAEEAAGGRRRIRFVATVPAAGFVAAAIVPDEDEEARPRETGHGPRSISAGGLTLDVDPRNGAVLRRDAPGRARELFRIEPALPGDRAPRRIETRSAAVCADAAVVWSGPRGETRLEIRIASGSPIVLASLRAPGGSARIVVPAESFAPPEAAVGTPFARRALAPGESAPYAQRFAAITARGETTALLLDEVAPVRFDRAALVCTPGESGPAGEFRFGIAVSPFEAPLARAAAGFAAPLLLAAGALGGADESELPARHSFLSVEPDNVLVSAVKPAYGDDPGIVIRLVECEGRRTTARLRFAAPPGRSALVDLLERDATPLLPRGLDLEVELPPGAVRSVRVDGNPFGAAAR